MARRLRYRIFSSHEPDVYEEFMQAVKVDRPLNFEILGESQTWTREGEHVIAVTYIETTDEGEERY